MTEAGGPLGRLDPVLTELKAYTVPAEPPPVKLDANESPWPLPEAARRAIAEAVAALPFHRYPDGRARALRAALAEWLGANGDELVIGAGSDEVIAMLMQAFRASGGERPAVLFPGPSFVMYRITGLNHGFRPVEVDLGPGFALDRDAMMAAFAEHDPPLAFYATPNNPTGNPYDEATLRALIEAHPNTLHILDEAYGPFARTTAEAKAHTLAPWLAEYPNVGVLGTVSKVGLAALRVGWVRLRPELAAEIEKVRQPFNLSATAQVAAEVLLRDHPSVIEDAAQAIVKERARLHAALAERGLDPQPSQANFILARLPASRKAPLLEQGVALRFFGDPRLDGWARITVGTPEETSALLSALDTL